MPAAVREKKEISAMEFSVKDRDRRGRVQPEYQAGHGRLCFIQNPLAQMICVRSDSLPLVAIESIMPMRRAWPRPPRSGR